MLWAIECLTVGLIPPTRTGNNIDMEIFIEERIVGVCVCKILCDI